jgi:hypothetical protein
LTGRALAESVKINKTDETVLLSWTRHLPQPRVSSGSFSRLRILSFIIHIYSAPLLERIDFDVGIVLAKGVVAIEVRLH